MYNLLAVEPRHGPSRGLGLRGLGFRSIKPSFFFIDDHGAEPEVPFLTGLQPRP